MCEHDWMDGFSAGFAGAEGTRVCRVCGCAQACVSGRWIDFGQHMLNELTADEDDGEAATIRPPGDDLDAVDEEAPTLPPRDKR